MFPLNYIHLNLFTHFFCMRENVTAHARGYNNVPLIAEATTNCHESELSLCGCFHFLYNVVQR